MDAPKPKTLHYKRSHFATQLPVDYLYTPSHAWLARQADGSWRVGLTRFAGRMLGHMVDHGFETPAGTVVQHGQIVGWAIVPLVTTLKPAETSPTRLQR